MVFQQYVNVLPGEKLQTLGVGQFQVNTDNIVREVLKFTDPTRQCSDFNVLGRIDFAYLDGQIPGGLRLAEQGFVLSGIGVR